MRMHPDISLITAKQQACSKLATINLRVLPAYRVLVRCMASPTFNSLVFFRMKNWERFEENTGSWKPIIPRHVFCTHSLFNELVYLTP